MPPQRDDAHLEDMEGLKLYVPAPIPEHHHHQLQVLRIADVASHDCKVVPIKKQLSKKLKRRQWEGGEEIVERGGWKESV